MIQPAINCYFKKEIDLDWDEADNCYGEPFDNLKKRCIPRVVLEKLPDSVLQKCITKNTVPVDAHPDIAEKCPRCKKVFKNKSTLSSHRNYCGKKRNLQCDHCSYKTKYKVNLIVHLSKIHPEGKRIRQTDHASKFSRVCEKCKMLSESMCPSKCENCFSKLLYQCNKCSKILETHSLAYYHWSTRCGVKGYFNCTKCDFKSVWRSKVVFHMINLHLCLESSREFENIEWISLSHSNKKTESSSYGCPKCTKTMENSESLLQHVKACGAKNHVRNVDIESKDTNRDVQSDPNKCSNCGQQFEHIYSLNVHTRHCKKRKYMIRINNDSDVEVVETDEDLLMKSSVSADKRNARIREMIVKYCPKCHEETEIVESRGLGRKVLSCQKCKTTLLFKCKKCLKDYRRYYTIVLHLNSSCNPQEEFKCVKCDYKASVPIKVKYHYDSVHGTANVACQKCGKKFKSNDYLKRHMYKCGVKPKFQCEHCPFKSKLKIYLRKHIFRSHMEPIVIDRCESIKMSLQRFSRALIHVKAHCLDCNREQRLYDRLKTCRICKRPLRYKCKTCKKKYVGDDGNACDHVKGYLETIKFECKRCGRGAISEKSLWMHERKCGVKAKFRCRFCKYTSVFKGNTVKHEKVMHPYEVEGFDVQ